MRLLTETTLASRLAELLAGSKQIDIAVAWVWTSSPFEQILAFAEANPGQTRVLCGIHGYMTCPDALHKLFSTTKLKIAYGSHGQKLHSKLFIFRGEENLFWIGSANLTEAGFSRNREVVWEGTLDTTVENLFEGYWAEFCEPDIEWLEGYKRAFDQTPETPNGPQTRQPAKRIPAPVPPIFQPDWLSHVERLRAKNADRLEWLSDQLPEVSAIAQQDWQTLSKLDARKLLGVEAQFGGLGRLKGAGMVNNIFYEASLKNLKIRKLFQDAIEKIPKDVNAPAFDTMVKNAFELITNVHRVNVGTATRLLAVRYPDRFVSINDESSREFSRLSAIPQKQLRTSDGYVALVKWIRQQKWWQSSDPANETSKFWRQRAALMDILTYAGDPHEDMDRLDAYDPLDE